MTVTARECLAQTTHFQHQRTHFAGVLARMVVAGIHPDSTQFAATFKRFMHSRQQMRMQERLRSFLLEKQEWQRCA